MGPIFQDLDSIDKVKLNEVNQTLKQFLVAGHRIDGDIYQHQKTKRKHTTRRKDKPKTLDQTMLKQEPLKDPKVYQQEVAEFFKTR